MARATTETWQGIAVAVLLTTAAAAQALPVPLTTLGNIVGQAPISASTALNQGIECYRQGDYAAAAQALGQAQAGRSDLSANERKDLDDCLKNNRRALDAQTLGHQQLLEAEAALKADRMEEADALLKAVASNPFLASADKAQVQALTVRVRLQAPSGTVTDPARAKLREARLMMARGDFDAAVGLAQEATRFHAVFQPGEDTPGRVLEDIHRVQMDPKALLMTARAAFRHGDMDASERMARQAEHMSYAWTFLMHSDTPARLLRDIQIERNRQAAAAGPAFPRRPVAPQVNGPAPIVTAPVSADLTASATVAMPNAPSLDLKASVSMPAPATHAPLPEQPTPVASAEVTVPSPAIVVTNARHVFEQAPTALAKEQAHVADQLHAAADTSTRSFPEVRVGHMSEPTMPSTMLVAGKQDVPPTAPVATGAPSSSPDDVRKQQARARIEEARRLQAAGRLVEAYQAIIEAQKMGVRFEPTEENPQTFRMQLCAQATRQMEKLMDDSGVDAAAAKQDATRLRQATDKLAQARLLAIGFGLDCQPIDVRLAALHHDAAPPIAGTLPSVDPTSVSVLAGNSTKAGEELLSEARKEIRAGHNDRARALTEKAFQGPYGVKAEAEALLRTICAEEYQQRCRTAEHLFDAGVSMYRRQDYASARQCFNTLEVSVLSPEHQARLREIISAADMQPHDVVQASAQAPSSDPGKATASDTPGKTQVVTPEQNYTQQYEAQQQIQLQRMHFLGTVAQRRALERLQAKDIEGALNILEDYLAQLKNSPLEPEKIAMLRRPVDARLAMIKKIRADIATEQGQNASLRNWQKDHLEQIRAEQMKEDQVTQLMKQFRALYKSGKFREALQQAEMAHDLDPNNYVVTAAVNMARTANNRAIYRDEKQRREDNFVVQMDEAEDPGPAVGSTHPLHVDADRAKLANNRVKNGAVTELTLKAIHNDKEREIESHLKMPVAPINFNNTPLRQALSELGAENNVQIVPDKAGLEAENINLDTPLSLQVEGIQLQSALNLLLNQVHLTYVIKDEVLFVTTPAKASDRLERKVYSVADLIVPIEDHGLPPTLDLQSMLERSMSQSGLQHRHKGMDNTPVVPGGQPITTSNGHGSDAVAQWSTATRNPSEMVSSGKTIQDTLMELITNTIKPESWSKLGGPGTIDYFPLGMALIINQTPDIQEQIAQLLEALRRLQDLEVVVEVRFITLDEAFYERIGVDFGVNFVNQQTKYQPQLVAGNFAPSGYINSFNPTSFLTGITSVASGPTTGGTFTPDLGIPIQAGSFGPAVPPFGGFSNAPPDGGIQLGLAFLSDIQVYMLLEAASADRRTNVMQAPKVTMFNGQTSTITVQTQQFFVTNVQVVEDDGQLVFVPTNTPLPTGPITITVQAVVSADRRFVRMNLFPNLTNLSSPTTALFPVTTFITPVFEGGSQGQPIPFTQYLQQPNFTNVTVTTTVSVPDGGTVLLGGLKTLREGRNEFGPPILSQLPYINRLFKNVGYGRETESLMLMVTPRIIINEEEEDLQVNQGRGGILGGTSGPGGLSAARPGGEAPIAPPAGGPGM